jgi:hypothetical protein
MSEVMKFGEADLFAALKDIGDKLGKKMRIYLIGGCAMTFMGAKAATKDIDVIVTSPKEAEDLVKAMKDAKFERVIKITREYKVLDATIIMERPDKMRFDIFTRKICGKLEIDKKMQSRAAFYMSYGNLDVYLMSGEDIFLFKGMTERTADLDDMRILVERGIDWRVIKGACFSQKKSALWADFLGGKLLDLKERYGIEAPIIKDMMDKADMDLLERVFRRIIGDREMNFNEIAKTVKERFRYSGSWTRKQLQVLEKREKIKRRKDGASYIYSMK